MTIRGRALFNHLNLLVDKKLAAMIAELALSQIQRAQDYEASIIADDDNEWLHQYRVSLRKIRGVVVLFQPHYEAKVLAKLNRGLSKIMAKTGVVRDLDVLLADKTLLTQQLSPQQTKQLQPLFE
jgi:CHAD domain-containing protein